MSQKFEATSSREEILKLENTISTLRKDIAVLQAQRVILQHRSNGFEDTIHLLSREKGYVQRCMKNGIERNAQLLSRLNEMAKQIKDQEIQIKSATVKYEKLETKYEKKTMQCEALQRKMEDAILEMEKRDNFIGAQNNLISDLKGHIVQLRRRSPEVSENRQRSGSLDQEIADGWGRK